MCDKHRSRWLESLPYSIDGAVRRITPSIDSEFRSTFLAIDCNEDNTKSFRTDWFPLACPLFDETERLRCFIGLKHEQPTWMTVEILAENASNCEYLCARILFSFLSRIIISDHSRISLSLLVSLFLCRSFERVWKWCTLWKASKLSECRANGDFLASTLIHLLKIEWKLHWLLLSIPIRTLTRELRRLEGERAIEIILKASDLVRHAHVNRLMRRRTDEQKFGLESSEWNADESSLAYLPRICRSLMISEIECNVLSAASFLSKTSHIVFKLIAMGKENATYSFLFNCCCSLSVNSWPALPNSIQLDRITRNRSISFLPDLNLLNWDVSWSHSK